MFYALNYCSEIYYKYLYISIREILNNKCNNYTYNQTDRYKLMNLFDNKIFFINLNVVLALVYAKLWFV